jgi:hypothetical protein
MKIIITLNRMKPILVLLALMVSLQSNGQTPVRENPTAGVAVNPKDDSKDPEVRKGVFFITPFYEVSYFDNLKLVSHTNYYTVPEGEATYVYSDEDIKNYNDHYGTEYHSSMAGIKVGYQVLDGLGVSAYAGVNHFFFQSWVSQENTQTFNADYPAITLGVTADYMKNINDRLKALALASCNYTTTGSVEVTNTTGLDVVSSRLNSMYWAVDLVMAYQVKKFLPYAGVGFMQQFVNPVTTEEQIIQDDTGANFTEKTKFDSHYQGLALYGFAGLEYSFSQKLSIYMRSSFPNPFRVNTGIKIIL